jgi:multiple sugar transport system ATP-binding protein
VVLGTRAEDLEVVANEAAQVTGQVFAFELLGDATTVSVKVADQFITARAGKEFRCALGDPISFAVKTSRCYLFDGQTQNRMRLASA